VLYGPCVEVRKVGPDSLLVVDRETMLEQLVSLG
jgi:hypothetical protein